MTPVIRVDFGRVDPERFDGVDMAKNVLDLRPGFDPEQDFRAGTHKGQCLTGAAGRDGAQDGNP